MLTAMLEVAPLVMSTGWFGPSEKWNPDWDRALQQFEEVLGKEKMARARSLRNDAYSKWGTYNASILWARVNNKIAYDKARDKFLAEMKARQKEVQERIRIEEVGAGVKRWAIPIAGSMLILLGYFAFKKMRR